MPTTNDDRKGIKKPLQDSSAEKLMDERTSAEADVETTLVANAALAASVIADDLTVVNRDSIDERSEFVEDKQSFDQVLQPGALIKNRFSLVNEIGTGGMGVVYCARDLRKEEAGDLDSKIAIKLLSEKFKEHPLALQTLQQESKKSQKLAHPNIVNVYDFDRDKDTVFMTMELLEGRSLSDYMNENLHQPREFSEIEETIRGLVYGLDHAHESGIVHSDLKPANIYLSDAGVKILDFGIARAVMDSDPTAATESHNQTAKKSSGVLAFTPLYASLEITKRLPPDPRDDIFALAVITYQLLSGVHPYEKQPANKAHQAGMVPQRISGLPEKQWQGLLRGLALEREHRTPNAREFLREISPARREPWKIVALGLAVCSLIYFSYGWLKPPEKPHILYNPLGPISMTTAEQARVADMLEVAEVQLLSGRLIRPIGGSAHDLYLNVLEINPYNREAIAGIRHLLRAMSDEADRLISEGELTNAEHYVTAGLKLDEKNRRLLNLKSKLDLINY